MKISKVKIFIVRHARLHPVLVQVFTDDGLVGVGEAGIAYGIGETAAAGMVKDFAERMLIGMDPFRIEHIWHEMYDHSFWAKGGGAIVFAAMSAIETALWDIKGQALGVPIYELLGGRIRDNVRLYANGWGQDHHDPSSFAVAGERAVAEGYTALKCYPLGHREADPRATTRHPSLRSVSDDVIRLGVKKLKALRSAVGPDIELMIDLSGGLTTDATVRFCRMLEELDLAFVEEPCDPFDHSSLRIIADRIPQPIAAGERVYTRYGFRKLLESGGAPIIQPDIGNTGGIMEVKKIAAMAEAYNARVQPHVCGSPIATAAALQLDACLSNFYIQEIYPYWRKLNTYVEVSDNPPEGRIKNGCVDIPATPGLGIALNERAVADHLWAEISV